MNGGQYEIPDEAQYKLNQVSAKDVYSYQSFLSFARGAKRGKSQIKRTWN